MDNFMKKLLTAVVALFLLCYVGYQGFQMFYVPIQTETVYAYSMYETIDTEGFVVRNEQPVSQSVEGYIYYTAENGSRVANDGVIANIYSSENDARIQQQINQLDEEIQQLQSIQAQGTANKVNLDIINKQIDTELTELMEATHSASISGLYEYHSELLSLLNKRQITIGKVTDFSERISQLTAKKQELSSSFSASNETIRSPVAGYFVSRLDGYENAAVFDDVETLTAEDVQSMLDSQPGQVDTAAVGKVVGDYEWYLTCVLPIEKTGSIKMGDELTVKLPFVSDEAVPVTVASVNRDKSGKAAVIFKCTYMSNELSSIRKEPIQIQVEHHEGLRVPNSAIRTNDDHQSGVYVQSGNTVVFKKIQIEYSTNDYSICKEFKKIEAENKDESVVLNEGEYLKLYDDIITGGKGLYDGKIIR